MGSRGQLTVRTPGLAGPGPAGGMVAVEIEDTGTGIATEHLAKVFDPFFTTKPPGSGAGLGLNVAYRIVHRHEGGISVRSEPSEAVVRVELPAGRASVRGEDPQVTAGEWSRDRSPPTARPAAAVRAAGLA